MSESESVRLGVIGLGNIAARHIDNIRSGQVPGCELAALCSRTPPPANPGAPHFTDHGELIDSGLCDAVLVATPTCSHIVSPFGPWPGPPSPTHAAACPAPTRASRSGAIVARTPLETRADWKPAYE